MPVREELGGEGAADEACSAGDEDVHFGVWGGGIECEN